MNSFRIISASRLAAVCVLLFAMPLPANARPYSELVVFGGNFEDAGNDAILSPPLFGFSIPPSPPYYMGRFSNGPTWVDVLADRLGMERPSPSAAGGSNYAYGGAATGSWPNDLERFGILNVDDQVGLYLENNEPTGNELFFVPGWTSSVDFSDGQSDISSSISYIGKAISDLAAAGAQEVIVMNLPPGSRIADLASFLDPFNTQLSAELQAQQASHPNLTIHEFNAHQIVEAVFADPSAFGFTNITGEACGDCGVGMFEKPVQIAEKPNQFLYWDKVDFSAPVHDLLGRSAYELLTAENDAKCDLVLDGVCDISDIDRLMTSIAAETHVLEFDLNVDGRVDNLDRDFWLAEAGPRNGFAGSLLTGDANLDGTVDGSDLNELGKSWQSENALWSQGNFTGANSNGADLNELGKNWRNSVARQAATAIVPEPSPTLQMVARLCVLMLICRRCPRHERGKRPQQLAH